MVTEEGYAVEVREDPTGWRVAIVGREGEVLSERACRDGAEARTYASTVCQHLYWLTLERFRSYYAAEG
jgi:hypothetical protein